MLWSRIARPNILMWLSLLLALLTGILVFSYLKQFGETVPVLVAARDLELLHQLSPSDVRITAMPVRALHPLSITDRQEVVGGLLRTPLVNGQVLLRPQVTQSRGSGAPVQALLAGNEVAFYLPAAPERGLGGAVRAGDRVDVVLAGQADRFGQAFASTLVADLRVLQVRNHDGGLFEEGERGRSSPAGVLIAATARDAERLAFALEHGRIYLALGSPAGQRTRGWGGGVTWDSLLLPAPPAPGWEAGGAAGDGDEAVNDRRDEVQHD
ncbi:MAG: Flp pilus assembly protein CpaB [Thermaerobacterales bacterium]